MIRIEWQYKLSLFYSPLREGFDKQITTIEDAAEKQAKAIEGRVKKQILDTDQNYVTNLFSKDFLYEEVIHEWNKIKEIEQKINRDGSVYKTCNKKKDQIYNFQKFETLRYFGREIHNGILALNDALEEQINLKYEIDKSKESAKPKTSDKMKKALNFKNAIRLLEGKQEVSNGFKSNILPIGKQTQGKGLKILTLKQW